MESRYLGVSNMVERNNANFQLRTEILIQQHFEEIPIDRSRPNNTCFKCDKSFEPLEKRKIMPCCGAHFHVSCLFIVLTVEAKCPFCQRYIQTLEMRRVTCFKFVSLEEAVHRKISYAEWQSIPKVSPSIECSACQNNFTRDCIRRRMPCCNCYFHNECLYNKLRGNDKCPSCERVIIVKKGANASVYMVFESQSDSLNLTAYEVPSYTSMGVNGEEYDLAQLVYQIRLNTIIVTRYLFFELLNEIKKFKMNRIPTMTITGDEGTCSICLENLKGKVKQLPCQHYFHEKCISFWILEKNTCPYCRIQF